MVKDEISKAKLESMVSINRAFYADLMPMIEQIKNEIAALNICEQDMNTVNRINEYFSKAESLLKQLKTVADSVEKNNES